MFVVLLRTYTTIVYETIAIIVLAIAYFEGRSGIYECRTDKAAKTAICHAIAAHSLEASVTPLITSGVAFINTSITIVIFAVAHLLATYLSRGTRCRCG